jgi:uncharacterized protein (TIGR00255 family)
MAIKSMTGYGRGEAEGFGMSVAVEITTVNRKQFDARVGLPRELSVLEPRVRKALKQRIARGSISATIRVDVSDRAMAKTMGMNVPMTQAYLGALRREARKLNLEDNLKASHLIGLPGIFRERAPAADAERVWRLVGRAMKEALDALDGMRLAEGGVLVRDLDVRLRHLRQLAARIGKRAPRVAAIYRRTLTRRLKESGLKGAGIGDALAREVALLADKADVSEELVRLKSHFDQVDALMTSCKPAGRTLDFVCQEMFREINTTGAKANDAVIARCVIQFKAELECLREQVQNLE